MRVALLFALIVGIESAPSRAFAQDTVENVLAQGDRMRDSAWQCYFVLNDRKTAQTEADKAKKLYQKVIDELEPHNAYAFVSLGVIALMQARHPSHSHEREVLLSVAHSKLTQADEKRKGYGEAHIYMAELYILQEDWSKADAKLAQLVRSNIEDSYVQSLWAYVLLKQKRSADAKLHLHKAVELGDPQSSATWARRNLR